MDNDSDIDLLYSSQIDNRIGRLKIPLLIAMDPILRRLKLFVLATLSFWQSYLFRTSECTQKHSSLYPVVTVFRFL